MLRRTFSLMLNYCVRRGACGGGGGGANRKGVVLGVYNGCSPGEFKFTKDAEAFDKKTDGKLSAHLKGTGVPEGEATVFTNLADEYYAVAVGGLGEEGVGYDSLENLNLCKENIRVAAGLAARKLQEIDVGQILVEGFENTEAAAEGAHLAVWKYQDLKSEDKKEPNPKLEPYGSADKDMWERGKAKAQAQNIARHIEEVPANLMTPTIFAEYCIESACPCGIQIEVRDKDWLETHKMNAFLGIAKTSCEAPLFVEVKYCGGDVKDLPVVIIGKGITYDTGSLCLKNKKIMSQYRGDLAGGAVVLAAIRCAAQMALPINLIGLIPLCESMIGGLSTKPGDVVAASNGKTILIANPDNEGRVILSDAHIYSKLHRPCLVLSIATLTRGMTKTLGTGASGVFTAVNEVWLELEKAGSETGDRFWRFPPFWDTYRRNVTDLPDVDVSNVGRHPDNSCQGAAFLKEFIHDVDYGHIDITGTGMLATGVGHEYLKGGVMSGRPTRAVAQFFYQLACPHSAEDC